MLRERLVLWVLTPAQVTVDCSEFWLQVKILTPSMNELHP